MGLSKCICGNEMDRMPNIAFRAMGFAFKVRDLFYPFEKRVDTFGIGEGYTVIDYGCGTGSYLNYVSSLVGEEGLVYAVDIHELAVDSVKKRAARYKLENVIPVLADGYSCDIEDQSADLIYAMDMFHMVKKPGPFLKELHRLLKEDGVLIIDDGHQRRNEAREKILNSNLWSIVEETKDHMKCEKIQIEQ